MYNAFNGNNVFTINPTQLTNNQLREICAFLESGCDYPQYGVLTLVRAIHAKGNDLPTTLKQEIQQTLCKLSYWLTPIPNRHIKYWGEQQQLLFYAAGLLAGELCPKQTFTLHQKTGEELVQEISNLLESWMLRKWNYGFCNRFQNLAYDQMLFALSALVDCAQTKGVATQAAILLDLIHFDIALFHLKGNDASPVLSFKSLNGTAPCVVDIVAGVPCYGGYPFGCALEYSSYRLPVVLQNIFADTRERICKLAQGATPARMAEQNINDDNLWLGLWEMNAFFHPKAIETTKKAIKRYNLQSSYCLPFLPAERKRSYKARTTKPNLRINPKLADTEVPTTACNYYIYRGENFLLTTLENRRGHVFPAHSLPACLTLSGSTSLYVTSDPSNNSYAYLPCSFQSKNVSILIYNRRDMLSLENGNRTYIHFPRQGVKRYFQKGEFLFAQYKDLYMMIRTRTRLTVWEEDERFLVQQGESTYWLLEVTPQEHFENLELFAAAMMEKPLTVEGKNLSYTSENRHLCVTYGETLQVDAAAKDLHFPRYNTPYMKAPRNPKEMYLNFEGNSLYINMAKAVRICDQ